MAISYKIDSSTQLLVQPGNYKMAASEWMARKNRLETK